MALSPSYENKLLTWLLSTTAITRPTVWYVALHVGTPGADGTTNEIASGIGYARQPITPSISGNVASNPAVVSFGPCTTTAWGTVSAASLWDAATGGTCIAPGNTVASVVYAVGDTATFSVGALTFTLT